MELIQFLLDFFLHLDRHLGQIITDYQSWSYLILFLVIFCETGLVIAPFLPGDSLLFAAGAFAAIGSLDIGWLLLVLYSAPILGDSTNYWIGRFIGPRVFSQKSRLFKQEYLLKTQRFYEKHGGKTIILARFMPIVRTFAPFVAGVGKMHYPRFLSFSVGGTLLWISLFTLGGYFFGNIPIVKRNFSVVIFVIIGISVVPIAWEWLRHRMQKQKAEN